MAKPKSFLKSLSIDCAKKAHNCQHNSKHRILKDDKRLGLRVERRTEYFCKECAVNFLEKNLEEIKTYIAELKKANNAISADAKSRAAE